MTVMCVEGCHYKVANKGADGSGQLPMGAGRLMELVNLSLVGGCVGQ